VLKDRRLNQIKIRKSITDEHTT